MVYCVILALLFVLEICYFKIADRFNIIDKPNLRSSHTKIVLRGGGIVFLLGAWLWSVCFGFQYPWFLAGLTLIADDIHSLPDSVRLVVQFAAMGLMFMELDILSVEMWWVVIIALIFCVGTVNAYNFMDGINGITGGYSLAVLLPLLYLNEHLHFVREGFLEVSILAVLVFCLFNFRIKAKCFAGDVGSVGIAFIVVFVMGKLILQTEDITYIVFLGVYGVDVVLTICHRVILKEHLGEAHRKHAYQLMANELRIPHPIVSTFYAVLQLAVSFGLILVDQHWPYAIVVMVALCLIYLNFMKEYYHLHEEYLCGLQPK